MKKIETVSELRNIISAWRRAGETIAFVPTMGNLHPGHLQLVKQAKVSASRVVVSIFVNPMQFGEGEDFANYPRTLEQDSEALQAEGVDVLFAPPVSEIYNRELTQTTRVEVPKLSDILCGAFRPHHFVGVTTVVAKLFNMVQPDVAVFGKKDYQQLFLITRMVEDLAMPIKIVGIETMREANGLAMSSRNNYLSAEQKQQAAEVYRTLITMADRIRQGEQDFESLSQFGIKNLQEKGFQPDYVEIRRGEDLGKAQSGDKPLVILIAARLGNARLIDNLEVA
jgi:pantoate--beta-alanine ligase